MYEALEDAGLTTAAINITCYRGRHRHLSPLPGFPPVHGPKRFFFYSLYESDRTGAPLACASRSRRLDRRVRRRGRPLARHARRLRPARLLPPGLRLRLARARARHRARGARACGRRGRRAVRRGRRAATRSSIATPSCSAPTTARRPWSGRAARGGVAGSRSVASDGPSRVTASNRAAKVYGDAAPRARAGERSTASHRSTSRCSSRTARWSRAATARRGRRRRLAIDGDPAVLDDPDGRARAEAALRNPNAGEVLVSAAPGWEFADLGGRHHAGGGSHGSLAAADSEVPMLTVGLGEPPASHHGDQGAHARRTSGSGRARRLTAPSVSPERRRAAADGRPPAPRARHRGRARARGDGARAARALRPGGAARPRLRRTPRSRSARARRLAAVHGRA